MPNLWRGKQNCGKPVGVSLQIREIAASDTYSLRHAILRPTEPLSACHYPLDGSSIHLGAFRDGKLLGVATAHAELKSDFPYRKQYRLRGMAVLSEVQGQGVGKEILVELLASLAAMEIPFLWCNAREIAIPFYERLGFQILGDFFDIPNIGRHKVMFRETK